MFKMKKRSYRVFEGLRVATLVSYIGGFIDAYTYNTQDERFASIQTGNLLYLVIHLVEGNIARAFSYAIPIFFFILGQFFVFFVKKWLINHKWRWHLQAIRLALLLMTILAIITPYVQGKVEIIFDVRNKKDYEILEELKIFGQTFMEIKKRKEKKET